MCLGALVMGSCVFRQPFAAVALAGAVMAALSLASAAGPLNQSIPTDVPAALSDEALSRSAGAPAGLPLGRNRVWRAGARGD